ncbi:TPA: hypothetical protein ACH9Q1_005657, partial [Escherichia coli]
SSSLFVFCLSLLGVWGCAVPAYAGPFTDEALKREIIGWRGGPYPSFPPPLAYHAGFGNFP